MRSAAKNSSARCLALLITALLASPPSSSFAQVLLQRTVIAGRTIPDGGSYSAVLGWSNAMFASITSASVAVNFGSPYFGNPIVLDDLSASLTYGAPDESPVTAGVFAQGGLQANSQSFNFVEDFDGPWKPSGRWELSVVDHSAGGIAQLQSWTLSLLGTVADSGTFSLRDGDRVSTDPSAGKLAVFGAALGIGPGTITATASDGRALHFSLGLDGSGILQASVTSGAKVVIGGSSTNFTGTVRVEGTGEVELASADVLGAGALAQTDGSSTVRFNFAGTMCNAMSIYNVAILQSATFSGAQVLHNTTFDIASDATTTNSGNLSGDGGVAKVGPGTLLLTGTNTYTGTVAVQEGTLELATIGGSAAGNTESVEVAGGATLLVSQSNQVSDEAPVTLSGGTVRLESGACETFGNLNLTANSCVDFGGGSPGILAFGAYTPTYLLTVRGFGAGSTLVFKENLTGTINNSSYFAFGSGFTSNWNGTDAFTVTAVPEPSTWAAAAGLVAVLLWAMRRLVVAAPKAHLPGLGCPAPPLPP